MSHQKLYSLPDDPVKEPTPLTHSTRAVHSPSPPGLTTTPEPPCPALSRSLEQAGDRGRPRSREGSGPAGSHLGAPRRCLDLQRRALRLLPPKPRAVPGRARPVAGERGGEPGPPGTGAPSSSPGGRCWGSHRDVAVQRGRQRLLVLLEDRRSAWPRTRTGTSSPHLRREGRGRGAGPRTAVTAATAPPGRPGPRSRGSASSSAAGKWRGARKPRRVAVWQPGRLLPL